MEASEFIPLARACEQLGISAPALRRRILRGDLQLFEGLDQQERLVRRDAVERLARPRPRVMIAGRRETTVTAA
jgi:predicted site-specific integrase-resolvase